MRAAAGTRTTLVIFARSTRTFLTICQSFLGDNGSREHRLRSPKHMEGKKNATASQSLYSFHRFLVPRLVVLALGAECLEG